MRAQIGLAMLVTIAVVTGIILFFEYHETKATEHLEKAFVHQMQSKKNPLSVG